MNRDSKRRPDPFTPQDFIVDWQKRLGEPADEEDGMAPEHVMNVMERLLVHQERRLKNGG